MTYLPCPLPFPPTAPARQLPPCLSPDELRQQLATESPQVLELSADAI
ncbi:hypothetical protein [Comamonas sp. GB3 AK4-5]